MDTMTIAIEAYFDGFFDKITFYVAPGRAGYNLAFDGTRNGNVYSFLVPPNLYEGAMLHHWLESAKGECITAEETILLEKK